MSGTSLHYVRHHYGVPAKRGMRVTCDGQPGVITSGAGAHIRVRLNGERHPHPYHPTWRVTYHTPTGDVAYGD